MNKKEGFDFKEALKAVRGGQSITGKDGVLGPLLKQLTEAALEAELDSHLAEDVLPNRKNGKSKKTLKTSEGKIELETPRDRASRFEPQFVKKYQTSVTDEIESKDGRKEVLGLYLLESEGANFWLSVLTDLQNRGVEDVLIASVDGLTGFPEAIETIFPNTEVQLCIVHQIRNSLRYVGSKHQKEFMRDLKLVYRAVSKDAAEAASDELEAKWGEKYPIVIRSWRRKWQNLSVYFRYPEPIRKVIYTTNSIEAIHRQFRKLTKTKGAFPNDNSLLKLLYLGIKNAEKKWTMPIQNWSQTLSQLAIFFEGRLDEALNL